jgi:integrator complex subunit 9
VEAVAPFQPLAMKVTHCPIDTSLNFSQANKLVKDLRPSFVAISSAHLQPPVSAPHRRDLIFEAVKFKF